MEENRLETTNHTVDVRRYPGMFDACVSKHRISKDGYWLGPEKGILPLRSGNRWLIQVSSHRLRRHQLISVLLGRTFLTYNILK